MDEDAYNFFKTQSDPIPHNKRPNNSTYSISKKKTNEISIKTDENGQDISLNGYHSPELFPVDGQYLKNNHETQFNTPVSVTRRLMKTFKNNITKESSFTPKLVDNNALEIAMCLTDFMEDVDSQFGCETFYGLPLIVKEMLDKERGIKQLYEWQHNCLTLEAVQKRRNLIYCLPTSGGKTLVAEILLWREVVKMERDALLILPYVAIAQEKVRAMEEFSLKLNFFLEEYAGRKGAFPPVHHRKKKSLYIATIEKANLLINHFIETQTIDRLGLVVVDELHMIGENNRGGILEMILTKLRFLAESTMIIGMSATIGNLKDLKLFLNAEEYCGEFRPVELMEYFKVNDEIFKMKINSEVEIGNELEPAVEFSTERKFPVTKYYSNSESRKADPDCVSGLVLEVIPEASCLVFCSSKTNCENVAKLVCRVADYTKEIKTILLDHKREEKLELIAELKRDGYGHICPTLKRTILYGVVYHHAGLTADERTLIEGAFLNGIITTIICTSTLAAGVNLPAKRVIIREPRIANTFLTFSRLKQMVGRAGRAGLNEHGESYVILKEKDVKFMANILHAGTEPCLSTLMMESGKGLKILLLNAISLQVVQTRDDMFKLVSKSLLGVQANILLSETSLEDIMDCIITELVETEFIQCTNPTVKESNKKMYNVNLFGKATCKGGFDLDWAKLLEEDLQLNLQSLVLYNTWFHILYLVTPYDHVESLGYLFNPTIFRQEYFKLELEEIKVAKVVGISEGHAISIGCGKSIKLNVFKIRRFYLSMILNKLWKLNPPWDVASCFNIPRGTLQNLLQASCHFAQNILQFCQEYDSLKAFCDILPGFIQRLYHCVEPELITLMELPAVKRSRASQLFKAGYKDIPSIAKAKAEDLIKNISHMSYKLAKTIIQAAKNQVKRRLEELKEEIDVMKSEVPCISN